jgi:hypothetical protein
MLTPQEVALKQAKRIYGNTAFTEHHVHYFRLGFRRAGKTYLVIGDTWDEAFEALLVLNTKGKG